MKVKDLKAVTNNKVIVYGRYHILFGPTLFTGYLENAPEDVLDKTVKDISAKERFQIFIFVEEELL